MTVVATDLIEVLAGARPDAVRLGEVVSLAVRVEPQLLRRARVELLPDVTAAAEADLWFSALVESAGFGGFLFDPPVANALRRRLARHDDLLQRAHALIQDAHMAAPLLVKLEEEIIWMELTGGESAAEASDQLLKRVLATMVSEEHRADNLARWAARVVPRLPGSTPTGAAARTLSVVASLRLGGPVAPDLADAAAVRRSIGLGGLVRPQQLAIGLRLLKRGIELSEPPAPGAHSIEVPETTPLVVDVGPVDLDGVTVRAHLRRNEIRSLVLTTIRAWGELGSRVTSAWAVEGRVECLAVSAGLAAGGLSDGTTLVWNAASGDLVAAFQGDSSPRGVALGGSPLLLATATTGGVLTVWDIDSRDARSRLVLETSFTDLAVSPDGETVAASAIDGRVRLLDNSLRATGVEMVHRQAVSAVRFDASGARLATAAGDALSLWDSATGVRLAATTTRANIVAIAFSGDGSAVAVAGEDGTVSVIEVVDPPRRRVVRRRLSRQSRTVLNERVSTFVGRTASGVAFSSDGTELLVGGEDGSLHVLDSQTGAATRAIDHGGPVLHVGDLGAAIVTTAEGGPVAVTSGFGERFALTSATPRPAEIAGDPRWYQKAVFYEVLVRGFYDSNNDGTGDLRGITERLDHIQWLGADCIWLLPFYRSPLRDGGYDISDFFSILPEYGDLADAVELVEECHKRGLRIIADLVMNHTSDQHPWFQESRQDRINPKADWYVWNDDDQRWPEARIIFVDSERSNWAWDEQRQQYYWHRFFSHEPDLNYNNPEVEEAMLDVVRFWLDIGLDGFRLDAVPYLYERDGTNGENLPETHEYLKRLRKAVDETHPGTVLVAEANQWPADVVDYYGDGDECHMCFHFPLMPRMFMAVRREQRYPITEILAQTPDIPDGAQWGIFLRNHDELTLEMVTDDERDYMYAEYAKDPRMKRNIGIGRRLAPLVDNDRRLIELMHGLLFSLPGSPMLYYGDEIGMGDNIYLGDRDGLRTPMQWTPERNAGFSRADFAQLYLPPLMDPVYGFQAVNVEASSQSRHSILHWVREWLRIRQRFADVFGSGAFEVLSVDNPAVLAFLRSLGAEVVLCVSNLSRFPQPVELEMGRYAGRTPVEVSGASRFPRIGEDPYPLTLGSHRFLWLTLEVEG